MPPRRSACPATMYPKLREYMVAPAEALARIPDALSAVDAARLHSVLGSKDAAINFLEEACAQRDLSLGDVKQDYRFDRLRSDPRFRSDHTVGPDSHAAVELGARVDHRGRMDT